MHKELQIFTFCNSPTFLVSPSPTVLGTRDGGVGWREMKLKHLPSEVPFWFEMVSLSLKKVSDEFHLSSGWMLGFLGFSLCPSEIDQDFMMTGGTLMQFSWFLWISIVRRLVWFLGIQGGAPSWARTQSDVLAVLDHLHTSGCSRS